MEKCKLCKLGIAKGDVISVVCDGIESTTDDCDFSILDFMDRVELYHQDCFSSMASRKSRYNYIVKEAQETLKGIGESVSQKDLNELMVAKNVRSTEALVSAYIMCRDKFSS